LRGLATKSQLVAEKSLSARTAGVTDRVDAGITLELDESKNNMIPPLR